MDRTMNGWIERMNEWIINGWTDGRTGELMDGRINGLIHGVTIAKNS